MYTIILIATGFALIVGLNVWFSGIDIERNQAALAYEQCVQKEYHMTPIAWYEQNHKYPLCGN